MTDIIVRPIISEKSLSDAKLGKFTFHVARTAKKPLVRKSVDDAFKVNVTNVSTAIVKGRTQRIGKRREKVTKSAWKKAIVQLQPGQKIDIFDAA